MRVLMILPHTGVNNVVADYAGLQNHQIIQLLGGFKEWGNGSSFTANYHEIFADTSMYQSGSADFIYQEGSNKGNNNPASQAHFVGYMSCVFDIVDGLNRNGKPTIGTWSEVVAWDNSKGTYVLNSGACPSK